MAERAPTQRSAIAPPPIRWSPDRDARGRRPGGRLARCSADAACPWRWRSAPDRPCPWHQLESDWDDLENRAKMSGIELAVR